jgi:DNA polymerase III delta prime subunit
MELEDLEETVNNTLLVEKYRPTRLDDVLLGDTMMLQKFQEYLEEKDIPNLIFASKSPGTGKSTVARILAKGVSNTVLYLNASLNRGIDTIRTRVEDFCVTMSMDGGTKIVLFEEFDNITYDAQKALLDLMEHYSEDVRFILTCNHINKVIDPIVSRCQKYVFGDIDPIKTAKRMFQILDKEGIDYDKKNVASIIKYHKSDIRSMLQSIQKFTVKQGGERTLSSFNTGEDVFRDLIECIKEKNLAKVRTLVGENNIDGDDAIRYIFKNIKSLSKTKWPDICYELCEGQYRMKVGVDKDIGLISTIYSIMQML